MRRFLDADWTYAIAIVAILILAVVGIIAIASTDHSRFDSFAAHCQQASGHIYRPDRDAWCLTTDGRIIEVYP